MLGGYKMEMTTRTPMTHSLCYPPLKGGDRDIAANVSYPAKKIPKVRLIKLRQPI